jgi:outer membrane protein OmpA-like peptidoglycan-associated protein
LLTRRILYLSTIAAALLAVPRDAAAQGFALNRFEPAERGSNWFVLDHLDLDGHLRPAVGATFDYQYQPLALKEGPDKDVRTAVVGHVITMDVGANVVLWNRVRLGATLPVLFYNEGESATLRGQPLSSPADQQGVGDLRFGLDGRLFGTADSPFTLALGGRVWLPTGSPASYTGDGFVRIGPRLAAAGKIGHFVYAANVGVVVRNPKSGVVGEVPIDHDFVYGASAGVTFVHDRITIGPELYGSTVLGEEAFKTRTSPLEVLLGAHAACPLGLRGGLGIGKGILAGFGSPEVRALASIEWSPPHEKPVVAPPPEVPSDNDGDGIPDDLDACPDAFGPRTNDKRTNGCDDRDKDTIADPIDACPDEAGVPHPNPKRNGCPADQDDDGIIDRLDACPGAKGAASDDPKQNGCPEPDRDYDEIPNEKDACPDDPGPANPDPKRNGCPVIRLRETEIATREPVNFQDDTAVLREDKSTLDVLNAVKDVLIAHAEITKVRVEGHTDNTGTPRSNQKLSQERADSAMKALIKAGIDKKRLEARGFGQSNPLDTNETEEGRAANRRVELHILETSTSPTPGVPAQPKQ